MAEDAAVAEARPVDTRVLSLFGKDERPRSAPRGAGSVPDFDDRYEVTGDDLYERGLALCAALLDGSYTPDAGLVNIAEEVRRVPREGWKLAEKGLTAALAKEDGNDEKTDRYKRAQALEAARRLVTALARQQNGRGFSLHIGVSAEGKDRYRL